MARRGWHASLSEWELLRDDVTNVVNQERAELERLDGRNWPAHVSSDTSGRSAWAFRWLKARRGPPYAHIEQGSGAHQALAE